MITLLTIVHVIVSLFLILVVLLQQGKSADWAGAFGGGGSQTSFGARGRATGWTKATTASAIIFMITSLALAMLISGPSSTSIISDDAAPQQAAPAPVTPPPAETTAPVTPATPAPEPEKTQ